MREDYLVQLYVRVHCGPGSCEGGAPPRAKKGMSSECMGTIGDAIQFRMMRRRGSRFCAVIVTLSVCSYIEWLN